MGLTMTGHRDVLKMLKELQKRQRTLKPFLAVEGADLADQIGKNWANRRGFDGKRWPAYKDTARTGGRLRGAERITSTKSRLMLKATHIAAFNYYGTEFMAARNPLPFTRIVGGWIVDDKWGAEHGARLKRYILGETSAERPTGGR